MPKIRLSGHIEVPKGRIAAIRSALPAHIALTRADPGCLAFDVTEDETRPGRFDVSELFASREDFDAHQTRMTSSPWAKITKNIPRHYNIEEVVS